MEKLSFQEVNRAHMPVVNSWYFDQDSFQVEQLTEAYIDYVSSAPNAHCWIISSDHRIIGKVDLEIEEDKAYIAILINPEDRGKGYGKRVLGEVIQRFENKGIKQMIAGIYHTHEASKRLFTSVGFMPGSKEPDEDGFINYLFTY